MLKNKLKIIVILYVAIMMIFTYSTCFAVDDISNTQLISNNENISEETNLEDVSDENYEEDIYDEDAEEAYSHSKETTSNTTVNSDLYLINGEDVIIDYPVDGNAYIIAKSVTITSEIGGDAFIIAGTVNIDDGLVYNNLFVMANNININGMVYNLYATGNNITIGENSYVYKDIHSASKNLNIFGAVGRNVTASCNNISFTKTNEEESSFTGKIYGNLEYYASNEATIADGIVEGNITFNQQSTERSGNPIMSYLSSIATFVATVVIVFLLLLWLAPKFRNNAKELLSKKTGAIIGFGLLGLLVIPIVSILLLIIGITSKIALTLLGLYIAFLLIASSIFIIGLSEIIAVKLKVDNKWKVLGLAVCTAVIFWLVELIPYVGPVISLATSVLGLGIIIKNILPAKKEDA